MANDIHVEEELHKLGNDVKSLNVLIASLLLGFEAFRGLGKISMARTKDGVSNARATAQMIEARNLISNPKEAR